MAVKCEICGTMMEDSAQACPVCGTVQESEPQLPPAGPRPLHPEMLPPLKKVSRTSAAAIWSLVLGILSFLMLGIFCSIPAVVIGHIARKNIKASGGTISGSGMALSGLILGYTHLGLSLFLIIMGQSLIHSLSVINL